MALYITHDGQDILYRGSKQITDSVEITEWPADPKKPEDPARKKDCYYPGSGSIVLLKDSSMVLEEYKIVKIEELREAIKGKGVFDIIYTQGITDKDVYDTWEEAVVNINAQTEEVEIDNLITTYFFQLGL